MSKPINVNSSQEFQSLISSNKYVLVDFHATWCGPCHMVAPIYEQLSVAHSKQDQFAFAKVDVDAQQAIAAKYSITAMPTFLLLKDGEVVQSIRGANPPAIKAAAQLAASDIAAAEAKAKEEETTVSGSYTVNSNPSWRMAL